MTQPVYVAAQLQETMEEPLIGFLEHNNEIPLEDETAHPREQKGLKQQGTQTDNDAEFHVMYPKFRLHGMIIGFLAQLVNVAGTTYMFYTWGDVGIWESMEANFWDTLWHQSVWLVSQVDIFLYMLMWVALTSILTQEGSQFVQRQFQVPPSKRTIFVMGVHFYVGVVLGVFSAWLVVDCFMDLSVPLVPMVAILLFGLFISYTMVWCYDMEDSVDIVVGSEASTPSWSSTRRTMDL